MSTELAILPQDSFTDRQMRFVEEYCIDLAPKAAAIRAGCPKSSASIWASGEMQRPEIKQAIDIRLQELSKESIVSAEWVRIKLKEVAERCMQAQPVMVKKGDKMVESGEYKFDSGGAVKALELLGKHIGMFTERSIVTIESELKLLTDDQLTARRQALIEEHEALDATLNPAGVWTAEETDAVIKPVSEEEAFYNRQNQEDATDARLSPIIKPMD